MFVCFLEMERGAQSESTATKLTTQWKPLIIIIANLWMNLKWVHAKFHLNKHTLQTIGHVKYDR